MVKDVGVTVSIVVTGKNLEVAVVAGDGHVVVKHILTGEVYHRRYGVVEDGEHAAAAASLEAREILVVSRQLVGAKLAHSIRQTHVGGVLHQLTLKHVASSVLLVRQRTHEDGVVEHR